MRYRIGSLLLLVCVVSAEAKDRPGNIASQAVVRANGRIGAFPEPPPKEDDTVFAVDSGPDLDTGCTFRRGGPLIIELPVRRYVGKVKADGTLDQPGQLTGRGLLSETALLSLPVFDVDEEGDPTDPSVPPERDLIFFNGKPLKRHLTGSNDVWKMNTFTVDIGLIRFPAEGAGPAINEIRIEIDDLNRDDNQWCTAVDWVALEFQAVAPIFLVHGVLSDGAGWNATSFMAGLRDSKIPYSEKIDLAEVGTIEGNGRRLAAALQERADHFGARKCHIIAHSKGGLDTRAYLQDNYDAEKLQVLTVYTLSTPHRGSPAADLITSGAVGGGVIAQDPLLKAIFFTVGILSYELTTDRLADFNSSHPPPRIPIFSYGAQADREPLDGKIDAAETEQMLPFPNLSFRLATFLYNYVGTRDRVIVDPSAPIEFGDWNFDSITLHRGSFVPNDIVVGEDSAAFGTYVKTEPGLNHTTMKSADLARRIANHIVIRHGVR